MGAHHSIATLHIAFSVFIIEPMFFYSTCTLFLVKKKCISYDDLANLSDQTFAAYGCFFLAALYLYWIGKPIANTNIQFLASVLGIKTAKKYLVEPLALVVLLLVWGAYFYE